ncbi:MAG TPA: hypothetical protein VGQ99_06105 [Tepidisphaeraceae bacterium]|nr:hypothetical protein [Tepidisphaeraceae bacterium]
MAGIDPIAKSLVPLFNPRQNRWAHHFRYEHARLIGLTACGRATVNVLAINYPSRVKLREELLEADLYWD